LGIVRFPEMMGADLRVAVLASDPCRPLVTLANCPLIARHRSLAMTWSPAHLAVEQEDLPRLRELLDAGHDVVPFAVVPPSGEQAKPHG
jgi:hypothetical protein